jgi:hypothetical protein
MWKIYAIANSGLSRSIGSMVSHITSLASVVVRERLEAPGWY